MLFKIGNGRSNRSCQ